MPPTLFARLFCCGCLRSRTARQDVESGGQVIPTETTTLIPPSPPAQITVDHQALGDKLARIVRAKEGKMVSVAARAPFTIAIQSGSTSTGDDSGAGPSSNHAGATATISRRPPVLTMTPARSVNLYADSNRRRSSRSSSRRRPHSAHSQARSTTSTSASGSDSARGNGNGSETKNRTERLLESASEADESPSPVRANSDSAPARPAEHDPQAITFSWD
ncbi:hypothetical protein FB451DRAFT_1227954 [Mycena latifolia]|nr:hypothetical protein FB451DRAFT_1227954 [Mycena latifolia]